MEAMCGYAEACFAANDSLRLDYETDAMVAAAASDPVQCVTVADLLWSEIDDETHYRRASEIDRTIRAKDLSD